MQRVRLQQGMCNICAAGSDVYSLVLKHTVERTSLGLLLESQGVRGGTRNLEGLHSQGGDSEGEDGKGGVLCYYCTTI